MSGNCSTNASKSRYDAIHLRLLQHELADQRSVGAAHTRHGSAGGRTRVPRQQRSANRTHLHRAQAFPEQAPRPPRGKCRRMMGRALVFVALTVSRMCDRRP